jgi:protein-disulfide isomerase
MQNNNQSQIAGAILIVGILIAGAILLKGSGASTTGTIKVPKLKQFSACLESGKHRTKVQNDMSDGDLAGIRGTPSSFLVVNGKVVDSIPGAASLATVMQKVESATTKTQALEGVQIRPVSSDEHILGDANAPVVIVEYSDTECPFCKVFHNTMHQVLDQSAGKVAWVYRHFPIEQLHAKAPLEAEATECAWEQGGNEMFWKYIDEIFKRTGSNDKLPVEELTVIAKDLGLK